MLVDRVGETEAVDGRGEEVTDHEHDDLGQFITLSVHLCRGEEVTDDELTVTNLTATSVIQQRRRRPGHQHPSSLRRRPGQQHRRGSRRTDFTSCQIQREYTFYRSLTTQLNKYVSK